MKKELLTNNFDYLARRQVLAESCGGLETCRAFVKDPSRLVNATYLGAERYLDDPDNWLGERAKFHQEIMSRESGLVRELSARLRSVVCVEPTLFAFRGNMGAGKTHMLRTHPMFAETVGGNYSNAGVFSPDRYKVDIRQDMVDHGGLTHTQCHRESLTIRRGLERLLWQDPSLSAVFDECFAWENRVRELIELAAKTERRVVMFDLDVPLEVSLARVAQRSPNEESPCVSRGKIRREFAQLRRTRELLVRWAMANRAVDYYLFANGRLVFESVVGKQAGSIRCLEQGIDKHTLMG